jgi:hypothetical protein
MRPLRYSYAVAGVAAAFFALAPWASGAAVSPVKLAGTGTATIDGVLSPGEWAGAAATGFAANLPGGGTTAATLLVMNDDANLYVAVRLARSVVDAGNSLSIEFDNDDDAVWPEDGDDAIVYNAGAGFFDDFRLPCHPGAPPASCAGLDADAGGTTDGVGAFRNDKVFSVYELSHPLESLDAGHDFALEPGDTVGFRLSLRMMAAGAEWPVGFGDTDFPQAPFGTIKVLAAFEPIVDGTVIDVDRNGRGDAIDDGLGSVVVGDSLSALGPGEQRGVFEFDVRHVQSACVESADLRLNVVGSFGEFDAVHDPRFTLASGRGDGVLSPSDFAGAIRVAQLTTFGDDVTVDVTTALRVAKLLGLNRIRFVLSWDAVPTDVPAALLFGSAELEGLYGPEFRAARLVLTPVAATCWRVDSPRG